MKTNQRVHILGICGTFMGGIAVLAKQLGCQVSGSDANVYPPMSTQLTAQNIKLIEGYQTEQYSPKPDAVIVGNALSRGNPAVEAMLNQNLKYISGPQWLAENILQDKWVLAVSGTHGKTTTTSLLAWILEYAGLNPGFLIGGVPENFGVSARLGGGKYFVIEADEYDTAFFDKRSKFIHYHPKTLILNNLEFDHADIFPNLAAIEQQFHFLVRTVPGNGLIIRAADDNNLTKVLERGCWTPSMTIDSPSADWQASEISATGDEFNVNFQGKKQGRVKWSLVGKHNIHNALAALAAAHNAGVDISKAIAALTEFKNVKRRLEVRGEKRGITVYDDFAHHPTAIATTLEGLRSKIGNARIIAVLECASNTMKLGVHKDTLGPSLQIADQVIFLRPKPKDWGIDDVAKQVKSPVVVCDSVESIVEKLSKNAQSGDHILIMSNGGFGNLHEKLLSAL